MKKPIFEGTATAVVTPFTAEEIDYAKLDRLLDHQLAGGVDAIVVCGTTGEAAVLTDAEQSALIAHTVSYVNKRCKVIAGTGSNSTRHCVSKSRTAACLGADALLIVTPYYNKCTQEGLIAHYNAVADAVDVPIVLYNVPSRTGVDISVETCLALSKHPNINGVKEASGNLAKIARLLNECRDSLFVWSGNDTDAVSAMSLGAKGLISVLSNLKPKQTADMIRFCMEGNFEKAAELQISLMPLIDALFCEVNPIPIKTALRLAGMDMGTPRLPLTPLSSENERRLLELLKT